MSEVKPFETFYGCKIGTYQLRRGTVLRCRVTGESFGVLTNAVAGEWLIKRALRGIPILLVNLPIDQKAGLIAS